ncbi:hypothetical protein QUV00_23010, partial [Xanthomonas citri pv. citri]
MKPKLRCDILGALGITGFFALATRVFDGFSVTKPTAWISDEAGVFCSNLRLGRRADLTVFDGILFGSRLW